MTNSISNKMSVSVDSSGSGQGAYFTVAYILMTVIIITQVFYFSFVVYSYQSIKKKIVQKGRLLQIIPLVSLATVSMQQAQLATCFQTSSVIPPPPVYSGTDEVSGKKDVPPPYAP